MDNPLIYLAAVVVVSVVISVIFALRSRKPSSMEAGIDAFSRELKALAPEQRAADAAREQRSENRPGASAG